MTSCEELRKILDKKLEQLIFLEREKLIHTGPYPLISDDIWKLNTVPNYEQIIEQYVLRIADSVHRCSPFLDKVMDCLLVS